MTLMTGQAARGTTMAHVGVWDGRICAVGCVPMGGAALTIRPLIQRELSCRKRRLRVSLTTMLAEVGRAIKGIRQGERPGRGWADGGRGFRGVGL